MEGLRRYAGKNFGEEVRSANPFTLKTGYRTHGSPEVKIFEEPASSISALASTFEGKEEGPQAQYYRDKREQGELRARSTF